MFCYQKDTKSLFAVECGKRDFWREIKKSSTAFNIDTRRAILRAIETQDEAAMQKWAEHTDYQKFMLRTLRGLKTKTGKEKWQKKPLDKKLLAWADDLKKSLTAFQFSCYLFDEATVKTKDGKTKKGPRRKLVGCHLNGLVMLDIDHVDNPMEVWEKLQANEKLMERVVLVHITSSGHGIRIIFTADIKTGNLADNQIAQQIWVIHLIRAASMPPVIRSLRRRMRFCLLTKKNCLIIMMKHLTSGSLLSTAKRKLSRLVFNLILLTALILLTSLRILVWPVRMLNRGLWLSAEWMWKEWRK